MILGIDYGEKKTGLAVWYPENDIVLPRKTIHHTSDKQLISFLKKTVEEDDIQEIVLGKPIGLSGNETDQTRKTLEFKKELEKSISIPVHLTDERLSTKQAQVFFDEKQTADEDSLAACVILETYIDKKSHQ
ncbi:Holliday junction resolvase RuvX [Patescibacteria group bacterium]|nr:Holliday junction resolvase RuvX [Patescibacteria group bacterium]